MTTMTTTTNIQKHELTYVDKSSMSSESSEVFSFYAHLMFLQVATAFAVIVVTVNKKSYGNKTF